MTIQWYPGHMAKATRELQEWIKRVDVVVELADARIPQASRNPVLNDVLSDRPKVLAMVKTDMADETVTKQWQQHFEQNGENVVLMNAKHNKGSGKLIQEVKRLAQPKMQALQKKGIKKRAVRAMIVGVPNVGKSTVINRLVGKNQAKTGDRPAMTRGNHWLKVSNEMELLDTPGILWPKFEDQEVGYKLAITGAIKDERLDFQDVVLYLIQQLQKWYPQALEERYNLSELPSEGVDIFETIGRKRGCLIAGGDVDFDQAAEVILRDFRSEKLGPISLEKPE
ncbi:ribosome biogenesis GTPase YlqF [Natribacillus halophilus]|uniref:Ribosome biogenesis GTPase A n=1 Tax=Natribacillus halophilus TaxID=549003 RepID=A0A1G8MJS0_9BACI|nr:ribosome biogenesis GTPase YlqF [Natribacillus halophilus]SDI68127.1 Ras superfamily GTP-binding protein YlqF [Natribacillus halophilus]